MFGYVTLGSNDLDRAIAFYDGLLALIGAKRFRTTDTSAVWGVDKGSPSLMVTRPYDGQRASVGNGVMLALNAATPELVDAMYRKALELGGRDEGAAGPRGEGGFYGGYFRDPDGNKLNAFTRV